MATCCCQYSLQGSCLESGEAALQSSRLGTGAGPCGEHGGLAKLPCVDLHRSVRKGLISWNVSGHEPHFYQELSTSAFTSSSKHAH